jgi:molybdenum cofactor cytidylyltransferase
MPPRARVAAIVLAAGASTRMGKPKALLRWRGRTFVEHAIARARAVGCMPVVVVQGAVALPSDVLGDAVLVDNPAWRSGQLESLQCGIRALDTALVSGVLVLTVDRPHVEVRTLEALVEAHRREPAAIWQPALEGRRGHPVLFPMDVVQAISALSSGESPRSVLRRPAVAARRKCVDVGDPAVLDNLDRPEDLARLPEA